jgi:hypothetical protein
VERGLPAAEHGWEVLLSSEDAAYGGSGTAGVEPGSGVQMRLPARSATLMLAVAEA